MNRRKQKFGCLECGRGDPVQPGDHRRPARQSSCHSERSQKLQFRIRLNPRGTRAPSPASSVPWLNVSPPGKVVPRPAPKCSERPAPGQGQQQLSRRPAPSPATPVSTPRPPAFSSQQRDTVHSYEARAFTRALNPVLPHPSGDLPTVLVQELVPDS